MKDTKTPYIGFVYIGDTPLDIHGYDGYFEEIYISNTDINVTEMIHSLTKISFDKFEDYARTQIFG
jgi:hypothetical protein